MFGGSRIPKAVGENLIQYTTFEPIGGVKIRSVHRELPRRTVGVQHGGTAFPFGEGVVSVRGVEVKVIEIEPCFGGGEDSFPPKAGFVPFVGAPQVLPMGGTTVFMLYQPRLVTIGGQVQFETNRSPRRYRPKGAFVTGVSGIIRCLHFILPVYNARCHGRNLPPRGQQQNALP